MKTFPPLVIIAVFFAVFIGLPIGLYILLTQGRRRIMREIRETASQHGWEYRRMRWQGDPTAFRIEGWSRIRTKWTLKSEGADGNTRGWSVRLGMRFPGLGGDADVAILPREPGDQRITHLASQATPAIQARVAAFSGAIASGAAFLRDAHEIPTGLPAFDAAYSVLALPQRPLSPPIDPALAERLLHWPQDAIAPHSLLAWRDTFGFHVEARLPTTPNWETVSYFIALAEDVSLRIPPPTGSTAPKGILDKLASGFMA